jgi:DME family drug/metabolite transporter
LAALAFVVMNLVMARSTADDLVTLGFGFAVGGLLLAPVAGSGLSFNPDVSTLGLLVLLGFLPTGLAYSLYFRGMRRMGASTAAVLVLLEPLSGTVLSALLLGERLSATGIAGAVVLAAAMIVAAVRPRSGATDPRSRTSSRGRPEC